MFPHQFYYLVSNSASIKGIRTLISHPLEGFSEFSQPQNFTLSRGGHVSRKFQSWHTCKGARWKQRTEYFYSVCIIRRASLVCVNNVCMCVCVCVCACMHVVRVRGRACVCVRVHVLPYDMSESKRYTHVKVYITTASLDRFKLFQFDTL